MPLSTNEDLLLKVIDEAAVAAEKKILQEKRLSYEEAIPLLLKSQYRRLVRLEDGMKEFREEVTNEIGNLRQDMYDKIAAQTRWMVGTMIAMTGIFGGLLALFKIF